MVRPRTLAASGATLRSKPPDRAHGGHRQLVSLADSVRLAGSAPALWMSTSTLVRLEPILSPSVQTSLRSDRSQRHTWNRAFGCRACGFFLTNSPSTRRAPRGAPPRRGQPVAGRLLHPSPMMRRSQQRFAPARASGDGSAGQCGRRAHGIPDVRKPPITLRSECPIQDDFGSASEPLRRGDHVGDSIRTFDKR